MKKNELAESEIKARPVVYDYRSPSEFLSELFHFYKLNGSFSLRQRTTKVGLCSQALVSQILKGKRQLNRDNLPAIAAVFKLTQLEQEYIDEKMTSYIHKLKLTKNAKVSDDIRIPKNNLFVDWLNPYAKDLVNLKGFLLDAEVIHFMLQGLAPSKRIKRSVEFLLKEGFWRTTANGKIEQDEAAVVSTNGVPNLKLRAFHKKALEIALKGIDRFPMNRRKASTVLISVDKEKMDELRGLVDAFQKNLLDFIERNPKGSDSLVQITTHLTPIGRSK